MFFICKVEWWYQLYNILGRSKWAVNMAYKRGKINVRFLSATITELVSKRTGKEADSEFCQEFLCKRSAQVRTTSGTLNIGLAWATANPCTSISDQQGWNSTLETLWGSRQPFGNWIMVGVRWWFSGGRVQGNKGYREDSGAYLREVSTMAISSRYRSI